MRADAVTAKVRADVFERDRHCFLFRMDPMHQCRNRWGDPHSPFDRSNLTLDHVQGPSRRLPFHWGGGRKGKRAASDPAHLVAMCDAGNVGVPSKDVRESERSYLAALYPEAWGKAA